MGNACFKRQIDEEIKHDETTEERKKKLEAMKDHIEKQIEVDKMKAKQYYEEGRRSFCKSCVKRQKSHEAMALGISRQLECLSKAELHEKESATTVEETPV